MYRLNHKDIDNKAIDIVRRLQAKGHKAYLVGGCVRDLLIGVTPKDFDIGTSARPNQVRRLIRNAFVIGKRFRLVLVRSEDDEQYEVATFRRSLDEAESDEFGDNLFGSPEEDAGRRDFTINALFYDPVSKEMIDFCNGLEDIDNRIIRMLGDPYERLIEDPIRILRALRFKYSTGFCFEATLREAMSKHGDSLMSAVLPRKREELLKFLRLPNPSLVFMEMYDLDLLQYLLPTLDKLLRQDELKAKEFFSDMDSFHDKYVNKENPLELLTLFIHLVYKTYFNHNMREKISADDFLENETLTELIRFELGVFKAEHSLMAMAMQMYPALLESKRFKTWGEKRQRGFVENESFELAYKMALRDYILTPEESLFWHSQ